MRIVGVPTKTLSELARITLLSQFQALFIYRFYQGLGNKTKSISSLLVGIDNYIGNCIDIYRDIYRAIYRAICRDICTGI